MNPLPHTNDIAEPLSDGHWINSKVARTVEIIRERWPDLDVMWIPAEKREDGDAAFALIETLRSGERVVAMYVQTEEEFDERVLEKLIRADMQGKDPNAWNAEMEARNEAVRLMRNKKSEEMYLETMEPYIYALKSGKNKYLGDGGKRLYYDY